MIDVVMPQMGESIVEGTLTKWLKKPGDKVVRDEPLFEISTDKVDTEIPAPSAGTMSEILVAEGATVGVNTIVGRIDKTGGADCCCASRSSATSKCTGGRRAASSGNSTTSTTASTRRGASCATCCR